MRFKVNCPECGDVIVEGVSMAMLNREDGSDVHPCSYHFTCPGCLCSVGKWANVQVASMLLMAGVNRIGEFPGFGRHDETDPEDVNTASMGPDDEARDGLPVLVMDDVIEFHQELESDEAIEKFIGS